mmetsp:Transcript_153746/g.492953  ORF Transcript_153746/g.492953 Transcript_153746/m.492953 type:complete len:223 (+) Transcript_153746:659-1327(+)
MSKPLNSPTRADNGMSNFNARTHSSRLAKGRSQRHSGSSAFCTSRSVRRCVRQSSAKRPGNSESWATASCMSSSLIIMGVFGHRRRNCFSTPALRTSTLARPPLPLCDQLPSGGIMRNGLIAASRTSAQSQGFSGPPPSAPPSAGGGMVSLQRRRVRQKRILAPPQTCSKQKSSSSPEVRYLPFAMEAAPSRSATVILKLLISCSIRVRCKVCFASASRGFG